mgnify:CR=1 FL=1
MAKKLLGAIKLKPKTTTGSIEHVLSNHKMFKSASMFSSRGIGYNTDTDVEGKKPMPEDRSGLKLSPGTAGLLGGLTGGIGPSIYGTIKDIKNQEYTGLDKMNQIDPGKFSWDRADFHSDRSAAQHMSIEGLKGTLKGILLGGLGGAGIGAGVSMAYGNLPHDVSMNAGMGGMIGAGVGALGGSAYGASKGADNYNRRVIDKL